VDGFGAGVFGRRYTAGGSPAGVEFQINTTTKEDQYDSAVAGLPDGGFVVTWVSLHDDKTLADIYAQRFNASANKVGAEFRVNKRASQNQNFPQVAALKGGGFVVVWNSVGKDGTFDVRGRIFKKTGKAKGKDFVLNNKKKGYQGLAAVAGLSDGGFIVVWQSDGQDGDSFGVYGRGYKRNGKPRGKEFRINTYRDGFQGYPSVAGFPKGGFAVTWDSEGQDGDSTGVFMRRFNKKGKAKGKETRVNSYRKLAQSKSTVAALAKGGFVVAWESADQDKKDDPVYDPGGIYAQRFKATGKRNGKEFRVHSFIDGDQRYPAVAGLTKGRRFVVTWESDGQAANGYNIYGQRYAK